MDLTMDLILLAAVQLSLGGLSLPRLAICQAALSLCTLLAAALGRSFAAWLHLPLMILCAAALTAERSPARILQAALCLLCFCAAAAGFALLGGNAAAIAGVMLMMLVVRKSRHIRFRWNIDVEIALQGASARFPALIDTGNRLREHASGLPVLIVEERAAGEIAALAGTLSPDQMRPLPFGVLGGTGEISCFRCDEIHILLPGYGKTEAPPCWTAIYPGRIPGGTCALAPPEFADAVARVSSIRDFRER